MIDPTLLKPILTRTRELVEQGWCQQSYAQSADGSETLTNSPNACRWCLEGALHRSLYECHNPDLFLQIVVYLRRFFPPGINYLDSYNDLPTTTQADVLTLLERAMHEVKQ